jgi:hypothetical protein
MKINIRKVCENYIDVSIEVMCTKVDLGFIGKNEGMELSNILKDASEEIKDKLGD